MTVTRGEQKGQRWNVDPSWFSEAPHLLLVLPSGRVQGLDERCCVANKHGVASGSNNHTQHGEPDIGQTLRGLAAITDAQHVTHGLEHSEGVELGPGVVLWREERRQQRVKDGGGRERAESQGSPAGAQTEDNSRDGGASQVERT